MEALEKALAIGGAVSVAVFTTGPGGDDLTWSAGGHEAGAEDAAAAGALAVAAANLVRIADPDDELGDILLTTTMSFHVLRVLGPPGETMQVALLTLTRGIANLALARREFKTITDRAAVPPAGVPETPPVVPKPRNVNGSVLPRRQAGRHNSRPEAADDVPPSWMALVGQPYVTDDEVLDRIIGTLRHL